MRMGLSRASFAALSVALLVGVGSAAFAQSSAVGGGADLRPDPAALAAAQAAQEIPSAYGTTNYTIYQIPGAAFQPRGGGAAYATDGGNAGLIWLTAVTGGDRIMWAPVYLPTGAKVAYVDTYACDNSVSSLHVETYLTGYSGYQSPLPGHTDFSAFTTTSDTTTPCRYFVKAITHTWNNDVRYNAGWHYVVNVRLNALDGTNKLKGVDIWWQRQVTPAPATATFPDVPVGSLYHRYVEALSSSGITAGCGGGLYCPNTAVTRGQMAVFLSLALGLDWPH